MAKFNDKLIGQGTLEELTDIERGQPLLESWVDQNLRAEGALMQVIVSRAQRMIGINYKATYVDTEWTPELVQPFMTFWSFRYDYAATSMPWLYDLETLIFRIFIFSWVLCFLHEMEAVNQNSNSRNDFLAFIFRPSWLLINLPSIISPIAAEMFKSNLSVSDYVLWTGASTLVMLVRFFQTGIVVGPFRRMVGTLKLAAPQLTSFACAAGVTMYVVSEVEHNMFGVYTSLSSIFVSFVTVFDAFANGRGFDHESSGGTEAPYNASPMGYVLMYLISSLVLYLIFSQFFIAILVNAFDEAKLQEQREDAIRMRPCGFTETRKFEASYKDYAYRGVDLVLYLVTGYSLKHRAMSHVIVKGLNHSLDLMEESERLNERANRAVNRGKQLPPPLCSIGLATRAVARNAFIERNLSKLTIHRLENDYHYMPPTSLELEEEGLEEATVQQVVDLQTLTLEHIMNLRMKMALAGNSPTASATDSKDDTKSEGSLSPEQVEKIKQVFNIFDVDGSGAIDSLELSAALSALGIRPSRAELKDMLAKLDVDGSGMIDFPEFLKLMTVKVGSDEASHGLQTALVKKMEDNGMGYGGPRTPRASLMEPTPRTEDVI
jgi:hypothetical protein